jgi:hypothetical protein
LNLTTASPQRRRAIALAQGALIALLPVAVCAALIGHFFSSTFRDAIPWENDEVAYWLQVAGFRHAGLDTGYFVVNERPAAAAFSRFGPHGPAFPALYGTIARVTGWRPYTAPQFGIVLIVILGAVWFARARPIRLALTAALLATFWPLVLFLPTTMQEPLHFAWAFAVAAAMAPVMHRASLSRGALAVLAALLVAGSLIRPAWALVMIPVAALGWSAPARRRWIAVALAICAAGVLYVAFMIVGAPYPNSTGLAVSSGVGGGAVWRTASLLLRRVGPNLSSFLAWAPEQPMQVLLRYQALAVLAIAGRRAWRAADPAAGVVALLLAITVSAIIVVGDVEGWRDYRVLGPMFLLAVLLGASANARWVRWLAVSNVIAAPLAIAVFLSLHHDRFLADRSALTYFRREVSGVLAFDPRRPPFGNTVLVHVDAYRFYLLGLPPGIGASGAIDWHDLPHPIRSRWVLLRPRDESQRPADMRLRLLARTAAGTLYENLDWSGPR